MQDRILNPRTPQGMMQNFMSLAMKAPPDPGQVAMHERPGADLFVSRDMTTGLFALPLLDNSTMQTTSGPTSPS